MPIFQKNSIMGIFGHFRANFGPKTGQKSIWGQTKNIPLEIPLRILKNQKNRNEVRLGTLEPGMIVARRRRRRHHDDNTLLRGVIKKLKAPVGGEVVYFEFILV